MTNGMMTVEEAQVKAEVALNYLASTDKHYATAKAWAMASDKLRKAKRAELALKSQHNTASDRSNEAESHKDYLAAVEEHKNALFDFEILKAKRDRAVLTIEFWRSLNAARRQGNV